MGGGVTSRWIRVAVVALGAMLGAAVGAWAPVSGSFDDQRLLSQTGTISGAWTITTSSDLTEMVIIPSDAKGAQVAFRVQYGRGAVGAVAVTVKGHVALEPRALGVTLDQGRGWEFRLPDIKTRVLDQTPVGNLQIVRAVGISRFIWSNSNIPRNMTTLLARQCGCPTTQEACFGGGKTALGATYACTTAACSAACDVGEGACAWCGVGIACCGCCTWK